jgi:hypothetical protein
MAPDWTGRSRTGEQKLENNPMQSSRARRKHDFGICENKLTRRTNQSYIATIGQGYLHEKLDRPTSARAGIGYQRDPDSVPGPVSMQLRTIYLVVFNHLARDQPMH